MRAPRARRTASLAKRLLDAAAGAAAVTLLWLVRRADPERTARFAGWALGRIGPWLKEDRIARENLVAAFPEKPAAEIAAILRRSWVNLGRIGGEYAHLDRIFAAGRLTFDKTTAARFDALRDDGRPALIFAAHLGNWELPALAAAAYGLHAAILYRPASLGAIADAVDRIRAVQMGTLVPTAPDAPIRLMGALERGLHVAMLVDQHSSRGVPVTFFGRPCRVSPLIARLVRHLPCPIHGVRAIRLPDGCFRIELTPELPPARTPTGDIDVAGTMQAITAVIEGWVREHPEQWLWQHRRWRD